MQTKTGILRVLLVDDDPVARDDVANAIARSASMVLVGEAATGEEAIVMFGALRPDLAIVDAHVPDPGGGIVIENLRRLAPGAILLALAASVTDAMARRMAFAGAQGCLARGTLANTLADTVDRVVGRAPDRAPSTLLTEREREVLRAVAQGDTTPEVARRLLISDETVKGHMRNIAAKLGARHRTHALAIAFQRGLIGA